MPAIGITGGVASGKSTVTACLSELLQAPAFDADTCARALLQNDEAVRLEVRDALGQEVFAASGQIDRQALRTRVFSRAVDRALLEAIVHPRVRVAWQGWVREQLQKSPGAVLLVELPLLYETGAESFFERIVVVGCGRNVQIRRLTVGRRLPVQIAGQIVASQWDLAEKIRRCDHLIWNDGSPAGLRAQAEQCARFFEHLY